MTVDSTCPECLSEPTEESVRDTHLSNLGYEHRDTRYVGDGFTVAHSTSETWVRSNVCADCGNRWTVGEPIGTTDEDRWYCGCGGDYIPHFVYLHFDDAEVVVKPKCMDCHHVPDDPIRMDVATTDTTARWFVGHHTVTGDRTDAEPNNFN